MSILNSIVNNSIFRLDEVLIKAIFVPLSAICVGLCLQMIGSKRKMHKNRQFHPSSVVRTHNHNFSSFARDKINGLLFSNVCNA